MTDPSPASDVSPLDDADDLDPANPNLRAIDWEWVVAETRRSITDSAYDALWETA